MVRYFDVPVNLPHAATVAARVRALLPRSGLAQDTAERLVEALAPARFEEPAGEAEEKMQQTCLELARELVQAIRLEEAQGDRLGQRVRNLFENLGEGREGSEAGLRCGEDPASLQRP